LRSIFRRTSSLLLLAFAVFCLSGLSLSAAQPGHEFPQLAQPGHTSQPDTSDQPTQPDHRQRLSLDQSWLFHEGDIPFPIVTGHEPSYSNAKAGSSSGAASPEYDDSSWQTVNLPHDWAVAQPFDPKANSAQGYRDRGIGWYRKYFRLDPADHGKHLELQLDGIATHATIWVNGVLSARSWSGYTSVYIDMTPVAKFGSDINTIAVRVDANAQEGWWYEGAGIYRHTWLIVRDPVHIATDGVYANPVRDAAGHWTIPVEADLYSSAETSANVTVQSTILDPAGKPVAQGQAPVTVDPLHTVAARYTIAVQNPRLWSIETPTLYSVRTVVLRNGTPIDSVTTHAGFRTLRFDPNLGFFLNDKPVKLLGTANHQDYAGVGVAVPDSIWDFRIKRLKEMGSNTYRSAHNAPAQEFLDACDRMGMLIMDENRNFGASPELLHQLDWEIRRDRNHPSIIMWSVFNEEPSQGTEMGYQLVRRMSEQVKELDTTRPVTAAQSNSVLNKVNASQAADVAGFNYVYRDFDAYHAAYPDKPIFSSEDTSTVMTRGVYTTDRKACLLDSYDDQVMPWGLSHRDAWKQVDTRPFVFGTMVWTGFDYRGEVEPLSWPAAGSSFGILDLCGFPKAAYYIHQAQWIHDRPLVHFVPHWNWAGSEGKPIKVMVTSNQPQVELLLNGKRVAGGPVDKYQMATFEVPYAPGRLEAIASNPAIAGNASKPTARFAVETTGPPAGIRLLPDRDRLKGDGADAEPVTVEVVDDKGRVVPTADNEIQFTLSGPGAIIGVNNGDPTNHESEKGSRHQVYNGLGLVVVQSELPQAVDVTKASNKPGALVLHATAPGLQAAETTIAILPVTPIPVVPPLVNPPLVILDWLRSPITTERPDPSEQPVASDMNSWTTVSPGSWLPPFRHGLFAVYRARFTPRAAVQASGGTITLHGVLGKAQVYLDGKLAGEKTTPEAADVTIPCPPAKTMRTISVLVEADAAGTPAGLGGIITVQ
jgi:beta-galactosidase